MAMTIGFFGGMAIWSISTPHAKLSIDDGHCRIGSGMIPSYITFSCDVIINVGLTGIFVWLIRPVLGNQARAPATIMIETAHLPIRNQSVLGSVITSNNGKDDQLSLSVSRMLRRNIIGSALTLVAGTMNLIIYFVDATSQIAYVCYTLCTIDGVYNSLMLRNSILMERQWYLVYWWFNGSRLGQTKRTKPVINKLPGPTSLARRFYSTPSLCLRLRIPIQRHPNKSLSCWSEDLRRGVLFIHQAGRPELSNMLDLCSTFGCITMTPQSCIFSLISPTPRDLRPPRQPVKRRANDAMRACNSLSACRLDHTNTIFPDPTSTQHLKRRRQHPPLLAT